MPNNKMDTIENIAKEVLCKIGIDHDISSEEIEGVLFFNIKTNDSALLIGKYGETLDSLEHILKILSRRKFDITENFPKIVFDVNDYKKNQIESLKKSAKISAENVSKYGRPEVLRPMNAYERRIIHLLLKEYENLITESIGENPNRRIVIKIRNNIN